MRLAEVLDLGVIANGIEEAAVADTLLDLGCMRGQGFLFARPVSATDTSAFLAAGSVTPWCSIG